MEDQSKQNTLFTLQQVKTVIQKHPRFNIVFVGLILVLPLFIFGISQSHSFAFNIVWSTGFTEHLFAGEWYPRWIEHPNQRLGSPVFFFYPPLFYYFTAFVDFITGFTLSNIYSVGWAAALILPLSGLSMYQLLLYQRGVTSKFAMLGAMLYMAAPYHLQLDLYVRGALGEYFSFVWLPLVFLATQKIIHEKQQGKVLLALSYGALILSHLPTALFTVPFVVVIALGETYQLEETSRHKIFKIIFVGLSAALGCLLVSLYLVPALLTQGFISVVALWDDPYFSYSKWFLTSVSAWPSQNIMITLVTLTLLYLGAILLYLYHYFQPSQKDKQDTLSIWVFVSFLAIFLMTELSAPIWKMIPILQKIQFPWRIMSILELSAIVIMMLLLSRWSKEKAPKFWMRALQIPFLLLWLVPSIIPIYAQSVKYWYNPNVHKLMKQELDWGRDAEEYKPKWVPLAFKTSWRPQVRPMASIGMNENTLAILADGSALKTEHPSLGQYIISGVATKDTHIIVRQYYYPIWQALTSKGDVLIATPSEKGLLSFAVKKGSFHITVSKQPLKEEKIGQILSLIGLFLLFLLWFSKRAWFITMQQKLFRSHIASQPQ